MNGMSALLRRITGDDLHSPSPVRLPQEGGFLQTRKRILIRNQISQHLDRGLPSFQNCGKKVLVAWLPPGLRYFVVAAQAKTLFQIRDLKEPPLSIARESMCWLGGSTDLALDSLV